MYDAAVEVFQKTLSVLTSLPIVADPSTPTLSELYGPGAPIGVEP